jgi:iron complex outermembrane receptor protein
MNTYHARPKSAAALLATLLFTLLAVVGRAQTSAPASPATKEEEDSSEVVTLEKLTVTTGYRSPKAIDQIPGAIKLISFEEVANTQFLTEDATEVLARTIRGCPRRR